ncbi:MAG: gliding motility-associated C-terminal domain-containing protein, partial [Runella slithyformis]
PNPSFNGTTNKNILTGGTLAVEQEEKITIVININPNGSTSTFPGSVTATGQNGSTGVTDNSNTGVVVNQPVNTPTPVRFDLPSTLIGLAKSAGIPEKLGGGKFKIPYTISVTNLGTTNLAKVQVMDDLTKTFGSKAMIMGIPTVTADSGFVVDSTYRGAGLLTNLLVDSLSSLPKGITRKINLAVTVMLASADSINIFNNIAVGIGKTSGGVMASDTSTVGNNPDPNGTLDPRSSNVPTPITLNSLPGRGLIGVALSVKDTARQGDGSFNITYRVLVKNFGSGVLNNVQLKDTIANVFNELTGASFSVVGTPTASDSSELRINPGFDGDLDVNLLIAEQSRLSGGRLDSLFFTVNVKTDGRLTPYLNQVHARALAGSDVVQDISTNGLNPDPNGNNNPTELSEQEPTAVVISSDGGELVVPEGFSPNGDGINDKFLIRHPSGTKLVVEIYNRWMHLVYRNNQYENDWDGTANVGLAANNQGLPVGTYFYNVILQDANGSEIKRQTRFMTINR